MTVEDRLKREINSADKINATPASNNIEPDSFIALSAGKIRKFNKYEVMFDGSV